MSEENKCNGLDCAICAETKWPNEKPIINGIDVSEWELKGVLIPITECKYFEGIGDCKESKGLCVDNDNCYFKQLKRTRQINSELISKANAYDKLVILANDRLDIIDRLKQENEKLRQDWRLDCLKCEYKNTKADVGKYKQALEEIREIAKFNQFYNPEKLLINGDIGQIQNLKMTEIYNKINEVLNDNSD